ncbi:MAG: hypothetical protein AB7Q23_07680 [Hyphomonadaceae bacterium]
MSRDRRSPSREARNEQRKLRGSLVNAIAITMIVAALVVPYVNPLMAERLGLTDRVFLFFVGALMHLFAAYVVRDMEDRQ